MRGERTAGGVHGEEEAGDGGEAQRRFREHREDSSEGVRQRVQFKDSDQNSKGLLPNQVSKKSLVESQKRKERIKSFLPNRSFTVIH